jgi:hypothetical protein
LGSETILADSTIEVWILEALCQLGAEERGRAWELEHDARRSDLASVR